MWRNSSVVVAEGEETPQSVMVDVVSESVPTEDVVNLRREDIVQAAVDLLPEEIARFRSAIPVRFENDELLVAVATPSDELCRELTKATRRDVRLVTSTLSDINWAIDANYRAIRNVDALVKVFESVAGSRRLSVGSASQDLDDDAPVVQIVDKILTQAVRDRTSDVHIVPSGDFARIRFRTDGVLKDVLQLPAPAGNALISRLKVMAEMNIVERRRPQDGQLTVVVDGKEVDVRVATVATVTGENCVLRLLDKSRAVLKLKELGMPSDTHGAYENLVRSPFGMVLVAGPTGSGKTTTLYATLGEVSDPTLNVMTIEDPVEYVYPEMYQIQTNEQAGLTFATGLKSIVRHDPDVILVGEIRDAETTGIAVQAALTGHLVLSSVHAADAVSALHRFLDMGIESYLVASSVLAIVGQRLVRRICPSCKTQYTPSEAELAFYRDIVSSEKSVFYHGSGCNFCGGTGFRDRIGVYELLVMTPEIRQLVVERATQDQLRDLAVDQGMRTLRTEAARLVDSDVTTIAEIIRSVHHL